MAARYEIKPAKGGQFMFNLIAVNSQVILTSETYEAKKSAQNGIKSVAKNAGNEKRFEILKAKDGRGYFVLKASNGEVIGKSQMYKTTKGLKNGIASVQKNAGAKVEDLTVQTAKAAKAKQ